MKSIIGSFSIVNYIPLIVLGVFLLFVISGLIFGIIRGLKKQTFRLGWVVVTAVILFLLTPIITKSLMDANLSVFNITIEGIKVTTLNQFLSDYAIKLPDYGKILADNPEAIKSIVAIASVLLNSFIYVILFWLTKIILWPVWAILSATLIKTKRKTAEGVVKKPKHRVAGMFVGLASGLIIGATTLMPIMGVSNLLLEVENKTQQQKIVYGVDDNGNQIELTETYGAISNLGGAEVVDFLNNYYKSFTGGFFRYTGIEFLNNATFNGLSTATVNNTKIVLKDEVLKIIKVADSFKSVKNLDFKNYNQQKLNTIISTIREFVTNVFNVQSLNVVGNDLLPYVVNEMLNNPDFIIKLPSTNDVTFDQIIKDTLTEIKDIKFSQIATEINCVLDIATTLNNAKVLSKVLNQEQYSVKTILDLLNQSAVNEISESLFKMNTLGTAIPIVINAGFTYLADYLQVENFEIDKTAVSKDEVKSFINTILNIGYSTYNSLDFTSKYYVTEQTLPLVGQVFEAIKNYKGLGEDNYKKLVVGAENKLRVEVTNMLATIDHKFDDIKVEILNALNNLSVITDFKEEFTQIGKVFNDAIIVIESLQQSGAQNINMEKLGSVLDGFENTQMFGNVVSPVVSAIFKIAGDMLPQNLSGLSPILSRVAGNTANVDSWKIELGKYKEMFDLILDMNSNPNLSNDILAEDNTMLSQFGVALNNLKSSKLLGEEINNVVCVVLDFASSNIGGTNETATNAFAEIKANLVNTTNVNWQAEFATLKKLAKTMLDYNDNIVSIEDIGQSLNEIVAQNSALINRKVINEMLKATIDNFVGSSTDADTLVIIEKIKQKIDVSTNLNYKQELIALNSLISELKDINIDTLNFAEFGQLLDDFDAVSGGTPSVIVSGIRFDIVNLAINKIKTTDFSLDLINIITKIKNNVPNIVSFKNEFVFLKSFIDETNTLKHVDIDTYNFIKLGNLLDSFDTSALLSNVRPDFVSLMLKEVKTSTTDLDIVDMLDTMINSVNNISNYTTELTKLKQFIDDRNSINGVNIDTFNFSAFGQKLDSYNDSVLLKSIRIKIVNKIVDQINFGTDASKQEIILAINDILNEIKLAAVKAENNELTYQTIFTEIGSLKAKLNDIQNVVITKTSHDMSVFGTKLNELDALNIVPLKSSVRIHNYILTNIKTEIEKLLPLGYEGIVSIKQAFDTLLAEVNLQKDKCTSYLINNMVGYNANFANDYANINTLIANVINVLPI